MLVYKHSLPVLHPACSSLACVTTHPLPCLFLVAPVLIIKVLVAISLQVPFDILDLLSVFLHLHHLLYSFFRVFVFLLLLLSLFGYLLQQSFVSEHFGFLSIGRSWLFSRNHLRFYPFGVYGRQGFHLLCLFFFCEVVLSFSFLFEGLQSDIVDNFILLVAVAFCFLHYSLSIAPTVDLRLSLFFYLRDVNSASNLFLLGCS